MVDQFGYYIFEEVMKMMLEMVLSEKKAKENNIDIDEWYNKIDKYFISRGVKKTGLGFYKGTNKDFSTFAGA